MQYIASDFEIFPSGVAETVPPGMPAEVQPSFLAQKKAESLLLERPDTLIIGCDTSVLVGNTILGKPKDEQEAFQMCAFVGQRASSNYRLLLVIEPKKAHFP